MARQLTLAYPGELDTLTGGYIYDKRILAELQTLGWLTETLSLDARFPAVDEATKALSAQRLANVDRARLLIIDGLALGALGTHTQTIRAARPFIALVHHPLALESGIDPQTAAALHASEQQALALAESVIVTSAVTKHTLAAQYGVAAEIITVIEPGVDRPPEHEIAAARASGAGQTIRLLSVGSLVHRKGFDVLIRALGQLQDLDWTLTIVGDTERSPPCMALVTELIKQFGLQERINMTGALPGEVLARQYAQADLFVLASRYEGYGMAYTEALAWGLPVVGTDGGAALETLATPAARIVAAEDPTTLATTLGELITHANTRQQMQQAAREHARSLPTWQASGKQFERALSSQAPSCQ